jgi:hypothetical protein
MPAWKAVRDKHEAVSAQQQVSGSWRPAGQQDAIDALGSKLVECAASFLATRNPAGLLDLRDALDELWGMVATPEAAAQHVVTTAEQGMYHDHLVWHPQPNQK